VKFRQLVNKVVRPTGYSIQKYDRGMFDRDGLTTRHNHDFETDPKFSAAYTRGVQAAGDDYGIQWRVHIALWAAFAASKLEGDFIECGVNRGFLSSAIMEYLNWDALNKTFFLLDTYEGIDVRLLSEAELKLGAAERNRRYLDSGFYVSGVDIVRQNFSQWKGTRIIQGTIPETLNQVDADKVAFLHLDMNCAIPEAAAFDFFWDRMSPGAIVLLDDYGFRGHELQKSALDACAEKCGVTIAALPTGQGLVIKPA
jgi:hypothetical protein